MSQPVEVNEALVEHLANPYEFISGLTIADAQGRLRYFAEPHQEQIVALDDFIAPGVETVVHLKSRQIGDTTVATAAWFWLLYTCPDPVQCLILAHEEKAAKNVLSKIRGYHNNLPPSMQRKLISDSVGEFRFADTGAGFHVLTAGGRGDARSYTFQMALADEMAWWPEHKADGVWGSVTSTQHDGPYKRTAMISTPQRKGDLHERKMRVALRRWRARDPKVRFRFFRWFDHSAYRLTPPSDWEPTQEEWLYSQRYGLDIHQLYWRHDKVYGVEGIGIDKFRKEYPSTIEDGYRVTTGAWFDLDMLEALEASLEPRQGEFAIYHKPEPDRIYAAGVDPSWADNGDEFACTILDDLGRQVAVFATNQGGVTLAARKAASMLLKYNALTLVEANAGGGGRAVFQALKERGVRLMLEGKGRKRKPFITTANTRRELFDDLRVDFNDKDELVINDLATVQQMVHFRDNDNRVDGGRPEAQDGEGDDRVMALALANRARRRLPRNGAVRRYTAKRKSPILSPWMAVNRPTTLPQRTR